MIKNWSKIVGQIGWSPVEGFESFYSIPFKPEKRAFFAIPDTSHGLIPTPLLNCNAKKIHSALSPYASLIQVADLNDTWDHPAYKSVPHRYQIIHTKDLKLEKDTRNQIKQAERFGIEVVEVSFEKDYPDAPFFHENIAYETAYWIMTLATAARQKRSPVDRWTLKRMFYHLNVLIASNREEVIAGCIYGESDLGIHYLHSASFEESLHLRPNHAIMNRLIEIANGRDIWLGNAPAELEGLHKFKESFGAETKTFNLKIYEFTS